MELDTVAAYHCSAEWHLSRMKSKWALPVYNVALRVSKVSRKFFGSALRLADYFGCNERSIRRAYKELSDAEFFILVDHPTYEPSVCLPVKHKPWAEKHPGRCVMKSEFPWSAESNRLGQRLWSVSGGQAPFMNHHIEALKKLPISDGEIISEFKAFWSSHRHSMRADRYKSNRKFLVGQFIAQMNAGERNSRDRK